MTEEPKELYNGFLFLRTGDKVDSPLVAYTLNLESVNIDCLEEEFEEKIEALKNGKDVTIKLVCNKAEVVSPERIIEYACGKQRQPEIEPESISKWKKEFREYVDSLDIARDDWKGIIEYIDEVPSVQPEHCGDAVSRNAIVQKLNEMDRYVSAELRLCDTDKKFPQNEVFIVDDVYEEIVEQLPSVQPTLYGYNIEHLELIARVLQKEDLPPERVVEALTDIGRIVAIVSDEFEETLRKAVEDATNRCG